MRLYTDEELENMNESLLENCEMEYFDNDIPPIKESRIQKMRNRISSMRKKLNIKYRISSVKEKLKTKKEERKQRRLEKKEKRQKLHVQGIYTKLDLVKSFASCVLQGTVACISFAGALIAATSVFTIGFLPTLAIASGFIASSKLASYLFKNEVKEFTKIKNSYSSNGEENIQEEFVEEDNNTVDEKVEEINPVKQDVKNLNIVSTDVRNSKLTREQKIEKVKEECQFGYIKNLDVHCVVIPKEDIKLQKFIKAEIKKSNANEKIQQFDTEDKKILVLSQRSILK